MNRPARRGVVFKIRELFGRREKTGKRLLPGRHGGYRAAAKTYFSNARVNVTPVLF